MKRIGFFAILGLVTLLLVAAFSVLRLMRQPLGPPLELVGVPTEVLEPQAAQAQDDPPQKKTCGNSGVMDLLVLGLASPETPGERGADAIRLVRVDFDQPAVGILALPPDTLLSAEDAESLWNYGVAEATLTQVFWLVQESEQGTELAQEGVQGTELVRQRKATQALAQMLLEAYEFAPDHYITVDQVSMLKMVDAIGGIEVDVPYDIHDVPPDWYQFDEGTHTLYGDEVIDYVRLLNVDPEGENHPEWERFSRQNQVLWGISVSALKNWERLPELIKEFRKVLITDLSVDQALDLNCILKEAGGQTDLVEPELEGLPSGPKFVEPEQEQVTEEDGHLLIDPEYVQNELIEYLVKDKVEE